MAISIRKVADVVGNLVVPIGRRPGDTAAVLTNLQPVHDPLPDAAWQLDLVIGEGDGARRITIDLPPLLSKSHDLQGVILLGHTPTGDTLIYFRNRLFMPERAPLTDSEQEEIVLRVKKAVYDKEAELSSLRDAIFNMEAAIEYQQSGPRRDPIPEHVKLVVWARDGGACVRCGAKTELHFDHIIPVAKGGGNTDANIQILCQTCNLRKSDKIALA